MVIVGLYLFVLFCINIMFQGTIIQLSAVYNCSQLYKLCLNVILRFF